MKIIAVAACVSGVAHTYMAAEALEKAAISKGHDIKVETQGQSGIDNRLTPMDITEAEAVILTNDVQIIDRDRFNGKKKYNVAISSAIKNALGIIEAIEKAQ